MAEPNDQQQDFGPRMEGITVTKPIVYGDVARYLGAIGKDCGHTHQ